MTGTRLYIILLAMVCTLNGCVVYRLDVPQGNEVEQDQVDKLRPGLTKNQVQSLLGTSLLQDPFHSDRWEYVYIDAVKGKVKTEKKFTVFFKDNFLVRWEGDVLPLSERARLRAEHEAAASTPAVQTSPPAPAAP